MEGGTAAAQHAWWQLLLLGCRRLLLQHAAAGAGADALQALTLRTCTSASQISSSRLMMHWACPHNQWRHPLAAAVDDVQQSGLSDSLSPGHAVNLQQVQYSHHELACNVKPNSRHRMAADAAELACCFPIVCHHWFVRQASILLNPRASRCHACQAMHEV